MALAGSFRPVAKVLKTHGSDGQLVLGVQGLDIAEFIALANSNKVPVFIFFDGLPVPFFIKNPVQRGASKLLVYLSGIQNGKDAEEVEGCLVYMQAEHLGDSDDPMEDFSLLEGWVLMDKGKRIGVIGSFEDIPGNPCLLLENGSMIPFHEELILAFDSNTQTVDMNLPEGILDL